MSSAERDPEHEHALEWPELMRIALVALAAVAVWFRLWEPLHAVSVDRHCRPADRRLADLQGSLRESRWHGA